LQIKKKCQILTGNCEADAQKNAPEESDQEFAFLVKMLSFKSSAIPKAAIAPNPAQDSIMSCLDDILSNEA
jgi:hypothetical protein